MSNIEIATVVFNPKDARLTSEQRQRTFEFAVTNTLIEDLYVKAQAIAEDTPDNKTLGSAIWLSVPNQFGKFEVKSRAEATKIPVTVTLPASAKPGKYAFRLQVASDRRPEVEFSQSEPVVVELTVKETRPFPWLYVAIGAGVIAVCAIGAVAAFALSGASLGDACHADAPKCPANALCPAGIERCVALSDAACKKDEQCLSGSCVDGRCAGLALNAACVPFENASACADKLVCSATAKKCLALRGGDCTKAADCDAGACVGKKCGLEIAQIGCQNDDECPANQKCFGDGGQKACLLRPGQVCQERFCTASHCTDKGLCAPDDGSCTATGDCSKPRTCNLGAKVCQLPNGNPCGGAAECLSGNCQGGTCQQAMAVTCTTVCPPGSPCVGNFCFRRAEVLKANEVHYNVARVRALNEAAPQPH